MSGITYLSYGGGVNSTSILHLPDVMDQVDLVIFADTGAEKPETYAYIEKYVRPFLRSMGKSFVVVRGRERIGGREVSDIYEAFYLWRMVPSRYLRICTYRFKVKPILEYLKTSYPGEGIRAVMGISYEEAYRAGRSWPGDQEIYYPLIERKITRSGCERIIRDAGWPVPMKSSCFFCPFQTRREWYWLRYAHPDLWQKAIALEKNGARYPEVLLGATPLEEIDRKIVPIDSFGVE
ncbi:MAG: hypothetical protein ACP5GL_07370 [Infirmifilum sp.]